MTKSPNPFLAVVLGVLIVAVIPLSAWGLWHGWSTIQADRRMQAGGLTVAARITGIDAGRSGTQTNRASARSASVTFVLDSDRRTERQVTVGRALARTLERGDEISLRVDPANPERRMLDRDHELRGAWFFLAGFGALGLIGVALLVWMLRGGLKAVARGA